MTRDAYVWVLGLATGMVLMAAWMVWAVRLAVR